MRGIAAVFAAVTLAACGSPTESALTLNGAYRLETFNGARTPVEIERVGAYSSVLTSGDLTIQSGEFELVLTHEWRSPVLEPFAHVERNTGSVAVAAEETFTLTSPVTGWLWEGDLDRSGVTLTITRSRRVSSCDCFQVRPETIRFTRVS